MWRNFMIVGSPANQGWKYTLQLKEEHDQQPNLIQQLEIGRQGLNMNLDQLAEHN